MDQKQLTPNLFVAGQIMPDDVATLAAQGFDTLVCNRPDGEEPGQPAFADVAAAARAAGMTAHHMPFQGMPPAEYVAEFARIAPDAGRILAYCRSGARSGILADAAGVA
jgi:sulfide:quinone oxidoreductase